MFEVLNGYLYQHKNISIPGLGTIYLETLPAATEPGNKKVLPPTYYFRFDKYFDAPDKEFFSYLASEKNIPDYEAIKWYNEFSYDLRNKIRQEEKVSWDGIGVLKKDSGGNIIFESEPQIALFQQPLVAEPITRRNAQQRMMTGDKEKTNHEMDEWLQANAHVKKQTWWIFALIAACVAVLILLFHFSSSRTSSNLSGNQNKLEVKK